MTKTRALLCIAMILLILPACTQPTAAPTATLALTEVLTPIPGTRTPRPTFTPLPTDMLPPTPTQNAISSRTPNAYQVLYRRIIVATSEEFYLVDAASQEWVRLTNTTDPKDLLTATSEMLGEPIAISPEGRMLAFAYDVDEEYFENDNYGWDIYTLDIELCSSTPDGCTPDQFTQLTSTPFDEQSPAWSPDGSQIAYISDQDHHESSWFSLFIMNSDGTGQRRLFGDEVFGRSMKLLWPAWSPDGSKIALSGRIMENYSWDAFIFYANADGTDAHQLTNSPHEENKSVSDFLPQWSPDGSEIVFQADWDDPACFYRVSLDNLEVIPVYVKGMKSCSMLRWTPDGKKIGFLSGWVSGFLYVVNPDGSDPILITNKDEILTYVWVP